MRRSDGGHGADRFAGEQPLTDHGIDPVVVGISYDSNEFFTFIEDAEDRGAKISLILGDARLTMDPKGGDRKRLTKVLADLKKALF